MKKYIRFFYGKRLTRHGEQSYIGQTLRQSLPPPLSPSFITIFFHVEKPNATDATEWKMKWYRGLQSTSSALPKSFHLLPKQVVKQKTRSKTTKQKHQRPSGPYPAIFLNFFFFYTPYKVICEAYLLSLITLFTSLKSSLQVFIKRTIEHVNSNQTSTQWSTSSDCFCHSFKLNKMC